MEVIADETLEAGDCRLKWKDGGGLRDISTLSSQIAKEIEVLLADPPVNKDNDDSHASAAADSSNNEAVTKEQETQDQDDISQPEPDGEQ